MNKTQLVDAVAARTEISKVNVKRTIDSFLDIVAETLRAGDKVTLPGFGSFVVCEKPARTGRNFRTGASIEIPPRKAVKFRCSVDQDKETPGF